MLHACAAITCVVYGAGYYMQWVTCCGAGCLDLGAAWSCMLYLYARFINILTLQCNISEIPWTFHKPNRNLYGGFNIRRYKLTYGFFFLENPRPIIELYLWHVKYLGHGEAGNVMTGIRVL